MTTIAYISYYNGRKELCNFPVWKSFNKFMDDKRATKICLYTGEGARTYKKNGRKIVLIKDSDERSAQSI